MLPAWLEVERYRSRVVVAAVAAVARAPVDESGRLLLCERGAEPDVVEQFVACGPTPPRRPLRDETRQSELRSSWLSLCAVAVAQTLGEAAGSLLRVGSEIRHRIRHVKSVRSDVVAASLSSGHLRERASTFRDGFMQQPPRIAEATAAAPGTLARRPQRSRPTPAETRLLCADSDSKRRSR
jgi:hypothetical protein